MFLRCFIFVMKWDGLLTFPCDFHSLCKYLLGSTCFFLRRVILEMSVTNIHDFQRLHPFPFNLLSSGLAYLQILKSEIECITSDVRGLKWRDHMDRGVSYIKCYSLACAHQRDASVSWHDEDSVPWGSEEEGVTVKPLALLIFSSFPVWVSSHCMAALQPHATYLGKWKGSLSSLKILSSQYQTARLKAVHKPYDAYCMFKSQALFKSAISRSIVGTQL